MQKQFSDSEVSRNDVGREMFRLHAISRVTLTPFPKDFSFGVLKPDSHKVSSKVHNGYLWCPLAKVCLSFPHPSIGVTRPLKIVQDHDHQGELSSAGA